MANLKKLWTREFPLNMVKTYSRVTTFLVFILVSSVGHAEQFVEADGFRVHYSVITTTDLTPQVARTFSIKRSKNRALVVLNPQRVEADGSTTPIAGSALGDAKNLIGQSKKLSFRQASEGKVFYLLAELKISNLEYQTLAISVTPEGASTPLTIDYTQQFFVD